VIEGMDLVDKFFANCGDHRIRPYYDAGQAYLDRLPQFGPIVTAVVM
jgi:hypothetical protein